MRTYRMFVLASMTSLVACARTADVHPNDELVVDTPISVAAATLRPAEVHRALLASRSLHWLGEQGRCAYTILGQEGVSVYIWYVCGRLERQADGGMNLSAGVSAPAALKVATGRAELRVESVEMPGDDDRYEPDCRRIFPADVRQAISAPAEESNRRVRALENALRGGAGR